MSCHGLGPELTGGRSASAWTQVVEEMLVMGAQASSDEARLIAAYLSHTYPSKK
jgi:hypothetical protein